MNKIAEIKVSYNATHAKTKISSSLKAYEILLANWDDETIELHEEFNQNNYPKDDTIRE
jgi:hypothetical protein